MGKLINFIMGLVTGTLRKDSDRQGLGIVGEDEGDQDGASHLLGEYEIPDAERLLKELERQGIPFEIESNDEIGNARSKGSGGRWTKLKVWISKKHQSDAERVQTSVLKIQV